MTYVSRLLSTIIAFLITLVCFGIFTFQVKAMECATGYEPNADDSGCVATGSSDTGSYEMGSAYDTTGGGSGTAVDPCANDPFANTDCVNKGSGGGSVAGGGSDPGGGAVRTGDTGKLSNPLQSKSIEEFILKIIDVLLVFAIPIIMLYIMYAGYLFVTAQGDSGQITTARSALLWAVVGGVIVLGAKVIVEVIQGTIKAF